MGHRVLSDTEIAPQRKLVVASKYAKEHATAGTAPTMEMASNMRLFSKSWRPKRPNIDAKVLHIKNFHVAFLPKVRPKTFLALPFHPERSLQFSPRRPFTRALPKILPALPLHPECSPRSAP